MELDIELLEVKDNGDTAYVVQEGAVVAEYTSSESGHAVTIKHGVNEGLAFTLPPSSCRSIIEIVHNMASFCEILNRHFVNGVQFFCDHTRSPEVEVIKVYDSKLKLLGFLVVNHYAETAYYSISGTSRCRYSEFRSKPIDHIQRWICEAISQKIGAQ